MALSDDEIKRIARATAQEVVNNLHRYTLIYQEPETVEQGLSQSMGEELTASNWYRARAGHARSQGDLDTATLYEHIAEEEDSHYQDFNRRLADRSLPTT